MQAPADGLEGLVAHSVRELESLSRDQDQNKRTNPGNESERDTKAPRTTRKPTQAGLRHVETEQRRRDRINEGFAALKTLMPGHEKADKATFLNNTVAYIKQLQGVMQQLVSTGAVSKLPEEAQWNIRVLLPRKSDAPVATFTMPAAHAAAPTIPAPVADPAAATAAMLSLLLNQPNGMVGQQGQPGLEIAQLLQQAAFSQQVQAQQGQLLQALQMQQLFQAAQQSAGMLMQNMHAPGAAAFSNMDPFLPSEPVPQAILMPPMTVGCTEGAPANALPKARKNGKVRRHTSAARIAKPATEVDAPAVDVGRPAPTEVGF